MRSNSTHVVEINQNIFEMCWMLRIFSQVSHNHYDFMSSLVKFWITATLILFVLALWPLMQLGKQLPNGSESELISQAKLVDYFCLAQIPTGGRASNPKAWEVALGAEIKLRESAGEAAGDAGFPREQAEKLTSLEPGDGVIHFEEKSVHYILRSAQGRDWYLVLTKKNSSGFIAYGVSPSASPSPVAMAIGFALVGGGLVTLLARVAFGKTPNTD